VHQQTAFYYTFLAIFVVRTHYWNFSVWQIIYLQACVCACVCVCVLMVAVYRESSGSPLSWPSRWSEYEVLRRAGSSTSTDARHGQSGDWCQSGSPARLSGLTSIHRIVISILIDIISTSSSSSAQRRRWVDESWVLWVFFSQAKLTAVFQSYSPDGTNCKGTGVHHGGMRSNGYSWGLVC